ncbi:tagaturonate reductase [Flagellimonas iocasae]|uniref:Tagaturonate reductase n=1 Tax=Flagellimonas iocasae TaxID=2055905 RepID=A0ABW4Y2E6_9FLAO
MQELTNKTIKRKTSLPIRVVQFGEGNFLRAFVDWMIDELNQNADFDYGVAIVQPIEQGMVEMLQKQDGLYHLMMKGTLNGKVVDEKKMISCIEQLVNPFKDLDAFFVLAITEKLELIISNTTEAGIEFGQDDKPTENSLAKTFPGKLTQFLYKRFEHFQGDPSKGVGIIPCELIDRNGDQLKAAILDYCRLWSLPAEFGKWIENANHFGNTLVDRIVPGFPSDTIHEVQKELGYKDNFVVVSEAYHLWVIEASKELQELFPADQHGLNVKYVGDQTPYRLQKVRILNGSHTCMVAIGLLNGLQTIRETIQDEKVGSYMKEMMFEEIIPTIDLPKEEVEQFANDVIERFENPFIRHELADISLNSISKFKVRVLPSIEDYTTSNNEAPAKLCTAFAALIKLYTSSLNGEIIGLRDSDEVIDFFTSLVNTDCNAETMVKKVLSNKAFWDKDVSKNNLIVSQVILALDRINSGHTI